MQTPQDRIAELEAEIAKARRAVAFFTTAVDDGFDDGFDWAAWLEGRIEGPPPELARPERIAELETALRGLVARVDRAGGYASPRSKTCCGGHGRCWAGPGRRDRIARMHNCTSATEAAIWAPRSMDTSTSAQASTRVRGPPARVRARRTPAQPDEDQP